MKKIKYGLSGFETYFFDKDFNLYYSKDKVAFRLRNESVKKGSVGFKIKHKFYSRTGFKKLIIPFEKPRNKPELPRKLS